ncbi:hypothetical protein OG884_13655 [Streptosporangium sp. NBC_01755]|uniref:hypothetical protein n=1 Tax=unclassified Streptosporangium TaxID=2632669 RepID=UPI002DD7E80B|nr:MULTISPECIES: hypothetical protein [unclassified Streptosporangium]WSA25714.1 hypothetical protein OIE13_33210 [Streptosporangium sp. NBC_01810]WSD02896.1 hypothetical protein OG884_13655 [Streptosporangium sp. NBC_01755]
MRALLAGENPPRVAGPGPAPAPAPTPGTTTTPSATATPNASTTPSTTPTLSATSTSGATTSVTTKTNQTVSIPTIGGRNTIPKALKNVPSLRVLPPWPRQASHVRIFVHCPPSSNHAIIGSTAFNLKGSNRLYREIGVGLSDRGLAHRGASISYFALPGPHGACLKCVKVTMNKQTRIRRIRVTGRAFAPLFVRRFSIWQFFD